MIKLSGKIPREHPGRMAITLYFGRGREAVEKYEQFVREGLSQGRRLELVGGGLTRSQGGWSQVLSFPSFV